MCPWTRPTAGRNLKAHVSKKSWAFCLLTLLSNAATAQNLPSAGGQLQQLPTVPALPAPLPSLRLQQTPIDTQAPEQAARSFVAKRLQLTGVSVYTESELVRVSGFVPDRGVTLQTLSGMADKITQRYRQDGFLVARAYVPAQTITDGTVKMAVIEGQYGQLKVNNTSSLDPKVPRDLLSGLSVGDVIATAPLEERLLLLSDLPGVQVRSTLVPGASVGLSDLIVDVQPAFKNTPGVVYVLPETRSLHAEFAMPITQRP